jgi:hypothetical protein
MDDDRSYFLIRLPAHPKPESEESARADTKEKTSETPPEKILTETRNNRNVTSRTLRMHPVVLQKKCSGIRCWIFVPPISTLKKLLSKELYLKNLDLSVKCYILCDKDRL